MSEVKAVPRLGRCPQCGTSSRLDSQNAWRPFCSERCKLIDLGDWFAERHQVIEPLPGDPFEPAD
ncbi:MAG: DNA gyrase inhibitor YacG [Polycyclovorans sp.]|nr:DNA gyrase inhibitor YacG [Polycyclovorans sp.]